MTVVTWVKKKSRLGTLINASGGVSVGSALRAADANLEPLRDRALLAISAQIDLLAGAADHDGPNFVKVQRVYHAASSILDAASPFGLNDICVAAHNLCEIADDHPGDAPFDWRVVDVHVQTFRLLMALGADQAEACAAVLQGLQQVAAHKIKAPRPV